MNCRVCNQHLSHLLTLENMPDRAQYLSDTPEEHIVNLELCQCDGCGLVQLSNKPVWYWEEEIRTDKDYILTLPKADFYSLNRLEHIPEPNKYLAQFEGIGIIEVPNFDMILAKNLFAEIMLDHLMYFTTDTLRFTLQYNGFEILHIQSTFNDYILTAVVRKRKPLDLSGFKKNQEKLKIALDKYISKYECVAIYGASHQAFAYISLLKPEVHFIVDDSPMKQDKYSPVGKLPIYPNNALDLSADAVVIMGGGYSDEIVKKLGYDGGVAIMRDWGVEIIK
jgi:hypothetical protein